MFSTKLTRPPRPGQNPPSDSMPHEPKETRGRLAAPAAVVLLVWAAACVIYFIAMRRTGGRWVYALDDPYIHMGMAKNLVEHGVWGLTRYQFSSSSSSPLWTCVLALIYWVQGAGDYAALWLNLLCVPLLVFVADVAWRRSLPDARRRFAWLLGLALFAPVLTLVFSGMEHLFHAALTIAFATLLLEELSSPRPAWKRSLILIGLSAILPQVRYEALFLLFIGGLVLLWHRRFALVFGMALAAALPLAVYGAISMAHGWYPLPNSVLMRGALPRVRDLEDLLLLLGGRCLIQLFLAPHLLVLALAVGYRMLSPPERPGAGLAVPVLRKIQLVFLATLLLHIQFAGVGWFYRYEAYLVAFGIWVLGISMSLPGAEGARAGGRGLPERVPRFMIAAAVLVPLSYRGVESLAHLPQAMKNIHEQQWQMSEFLRTYYRGAAVAANDIGLVCYRADVRILDLHGLADMEVARLRRARRYDREAIRRLARERGVEAAVLFPEWFERAIPPEWSEAGRWLLAGNVVCGGEWVAFYAARPEGWARLVAALREFASRLPKDVRCTIADAPGTAERGAGAR